MKAYRYRYRKGFSLAEALIATAVLSFAAAGVLMPFTSGANLQAEGMRRTMASRLASDTLEQAQATPFSQLVTSFNWTQAQGLVHNIQGEAFTDSSYAGFSRQVTCENIYMPQESGTASPRFVRVTVIVSWKGKEMARLARFIASR